MSKQISAVEWYENRIFILQIQLEKKEISLGEYAVTRVELFKQAKEMEKEQSLEDYSVGYSNGQVDSNRTANQYYNETYKNTEL
jgi:hypothetical protein